MYEIRHIDVQFHFLQDLTKEEVVNLVHFRSQKHVTNILTVSPIHLVLTFSYVKYDICISFDVFVCFF